MRVTPVLGLVVALAGAAAASSSSADEVYKCGFRSYSFKPCSKHVVNTEDAAVPAAPHVEASRVPSGAVRRLPGETQAQFATRRHRAGMLETDRDECARLDTRIRLEKERTNSMNAEEVTEGQMGLSESRRRYHQLRC
jgi:hypothetical protein